MTALTVANTCRVVPSAGTSVLGGGVVGHELGERSGPIVGGGQQSGVGGDVAFQSAGAGQIAGDKSADRVGDRVTGLQVSAVFRVEVADGIRRVGQRGVGAGTGPVDAGRQCAARAPRSSCRSRAAGSRRCGGWRPERTARRR